MNGAAASRKRPRSSRHLHPDDAPAVARAVLSRVAHRVMRHLQNLPAQLSGDDSGLATVWDEFCVRVQYQKSVDWSAYQATVSNAVAFEIDDLPGYQQEALWLETDDGQQWLEENPEAQQLTMVGSQAVNQCVEDAVFAKAMKWSNPRIRRYQERQL